MFSSLSPSILFGLGLFTSEILQHRPQCNSSLWKLWLPKIQPPLEFPGRLCESHIYRGEAETLHGQALAFLSLPSPSPVSPRQGQWCDPTLHFTFQRKETSKPFEMFSDKNEGHGDGEEASVDIFCLLSPLFSLLCAAQEGL